MLKGMSVESNKCCACSPFVMNFMDVLVEPFVMKETMSQVKRNLISQKAKQNIKNRQREAFQIPEVLDTTPDHCAVEKVAKGSVNEDIV